MTTREPDSEVAQDEADRDENPARNPVERPWGDLRYERLGVLEAARWHWVTVVVSVIVLAGVAVALGLTRTPTYTANTRLSVQVSASSPVALPGSITAAEQLASSYSRQIQAQAITKAVGQKEGIDPDAVTERIHATPVPDSSVISITATGSTAEEAAGLANSAASSLRGYVASLRRPSLGNDELLAEFRKVAAREDQLVAERDRLQEAAGGEPSAATETALSKIRVDLQAALVQRNALQQAYVNGQRLYTAPLQVLTPASGASSDRESRLQLFILIGLAGGLAVGVALAAFRANRTAGSWDDQ